MTEVITACAGFLIAVLWFDLMFDVQVLRYRRSSEVPELALDSISAYYRRVTTEASPMSRLIAIVMIALLVSLGAQTVQGDVPAWVSIASLALAALGIGAAVFRIFGWARRLGARTDTVVVRSALARGIFRGHVICLAAMVSLLAIQLIAA